MNWRIFNYDPLTKTTTWFAHDPEKKKNFFKTEQDVTDILEHNQNLANHDDKGWTKSREWRRVAEIPLTTVMDLETKYGINNLFAEENQHILRRVLNDIDYRKLRTAPGRV